MLQGIAGGLIGGLGGSIPLWFPLKWRFVVGCIGSAGAALMYAFAADSDDYWRLFVRLPLATAAGLWRAPADPVHRLQFPASIIGSAATALTYVTFVRPSSWPRVQDVL